MPSHSGWGRRVVKLSSVYSMYHRDAELAVSPPDRPSHGFPTVDSTSRWRRLGTQDSGSASWVA